MSRDYYTPEEQIANRLEELVDVMERLLEFQKAYARSKGFEFEAEEKP